MKIILDTTINGYNIENCMAAVKKRARSYVHPSNNQDIPDWSSSLDDTGKDMYAKTRALMDSIDELSLWQTQ